MNILYNIMKLKSVLLTVLPIFIKGKKGMLITAVVAYVLNWLLLDKEAKETQKENKIS